MATSYSQHPVIVLLRGKQYLRFFVLRLGCNFLNLCEMFIIYLHSNRIQEGVSQLLAFILALVISKKSFVQSIFLGYLAGAARKASAAEGQNCSPGMSVRA